MYLSIQNILSDSFPQILIKEFRIIEAGRNNYL